MLSCGQWIKIELAIAATLETASVLIVGVILIITSKPAICRSREQINMNLVIVVTLKMMRALIFETAYPAAATPAIYAYIYNTELVCVVIGKIRAVYIVDIISRSTQAEFSASSFIKSCCCSIRMREAFF